MMMPSASPSPKRKRLSFAVWCLTLVSLFLFSAVGSQGEKKQGEAKTVAKEERLPAPKLISAYVFDTKKLTFHQRDAANLDQMNYAFALIKDGRVCADNWKTISAFETFVANNPHIMPVMSVGGWEADGFSQAAATPQGRKLFVDSAVALMQQHGFLGIDIDWEYPCSSAAGIASCPEDKENFTLLLADLRAGLDQLTAVDGKKRLLCIAVGGVASMVNYIEAPAVGSIVDQVNIMTYDMQAQTTATHHINLYPSSPDYPNSADTAVQAYIKAGIPREKIMVGIGFYGRVFEVTGPKSQGLYQPSEGPANATYVYARIKDFLYDDDYVRYYDDVAKAPYLFDGETFISYDDPQSIDAKGSYVKDNGLMGLMCWQYSGDDSGELLHAMKESLE